MKYQLINEKKIYNEESSKVLFFLYNTIIGRFILKFITLRVLSKVIAFFLNSRVSKFMIAKYIKKYNIDIEKCENKTYKSFNDFFIRKLSVNNFKSEKKDFVSTANSKITCYNISEDLLINIKNSTYSIEELIKDKNIAKEYENGICLIYRLNPSNYHRYIFCDDGIQKHIKKINGRLHTVNPIIYGKYKVFTENYREITELYTNNFGNVIQIEIGALCVGRIINYDIKRYSKYDEKGYFEFGGSTIIHLIKKNKVKINKQIIENSKQNIETLVDIGEIIGEKIK